MPKQQLLLNTHGWYTVHIDTPVCVYSGGVLVSPVPAASLPTPLPLYKPFAIHAKIVSMAVTPAQYLLGHYN